MRGHEGDEFTRLGNVRYAIREFLPLAKELESHGRPVYALYAGDPIKHGFDIPEALKRALVEVIQTSGPEVHAYGSAEGDKELREEIVKLEKEKSGIEPDINDVFVTIGLSEAIHFLALTLLEPGEFRTLPGPVYPLYMSHALMADARYNFYKVYLKSSNSHWEIDEDELRRVARGSKAIVVINPNNPASYVLSYRELYKIVDVAGEYGIPIIADQIYDDIIFDEGAYTHIIKIAKDVPVIVLNGFSKNFRITGRRIGYVWFYDPEGYLSESVKESYSAKRRNRILYISKDFKIIEKMFSKILRTRISGPIIIQKAIAKALRDYSKELKEDVKNFVETVKDRIYYGYKLLREIEDVEIAKPQGAFYLFPRIKIISDDTCFARTLLEKYGYYTVPGSGFGDGGQGHIRILGLARKEVLEGFANALRSEIEYIKNVRRGSQKVA